MTALREYLAADLAKKVSRYGLVVWQDTDRQYTDVAASVCPADARFAAYDGSWYALRREVEPLLAGETPPRLVVYAPAAARRDGRDDPLEEIRAAGGSFTRRLDTLVRNALKGQLSDQRLRDIGAQARTLTEAEAALDGDAGADVRLVSVLGTTDARAMTLRTLTGECATAVEREGAWPAAADLLTAQIGGPLSGTGEDLRRAALRQMALTEINDACGGLPDALRSAWAPANAEQRRRATELLHAWRSDPHHREGYGRLARQVDGELRLQTTLGWRAGLARCTATPALEEVAFAEALHTLGEGDPGAAGTLAAQRLEISPWVHPHGPAGEEWATNDRRWRAVQATADLATSTADTRPPPNASPAQLLEWYVADGWTVDRAHRDFEMARNALRILGDLEPTFTTARVAYERWLEDTLLAFTTAVARHGLDAGALTRQGDVHARWVRDAAGPIAYVWVDALRYELGVELHEGLCADGHSVQLYPAVAAAPTITPVGMANLTPGAGAGLTLELDGGALVVRVDGAKVATVSDRVARLRAAHGGKVLDRSLDVIANQGEKELSRTLGDAALLLVRSQELDSAGESGMLNAAWPQFRGVLDLLRTVVARLGQAGVRRIVITADHGFVTLSRGLGADRVIDPPAGGVGELHRRGWVGKGASTTASTLRVPLSSTGVPSDLDLIMPRGLAVFRAGGAKQFFHGGLSPQELLVPVIVVDAEPAPSPRALQVDVSVAGGRITSGAFAATVRFTGDLFTSEITVRVLAQSAPGRDAKRSGEVARLVSGDGYDPATGAVRLLADHAPPVLTFQVTANLERDTTVAIEVLDARTGVRLGMVEATVSASILVEDDLE